MHWTTIPFDAVTTSSLIFFSEAQKKTCERVCDILQIDCFPDTHELAYHLRHSDGWEKKYLKDSNKINELSSAFDEKVLELFEKSDSHLLFSSSNNYITSVTHFTDFEKPQVYASLYQNLNVFELGLREYLYFNELGDEDFLNYLKSWKLKKSSGKSKKIIEDKIKRVSQEPKIKKPFENRLLSELMEYAVSGYHDKGKTKSLDLSFLKVKEELGMKSVPRHELANQLRNRIMHHNNLSGETTLTPHNFNEFKLLFKQVLNLEDIFKELAKRLSDLHRKQVKSINERRLQTVSNMNDRDINDYFYSLV